MADGTDTVPTATGNDAPQAAPAAQPQLVSLTPEQYQAELQKAKDAGAAAARRALEGRQSPKAEPPPKSTPDPAPTATAPSHDQGFEDSLADALADLPALSRKQRSLVRDLARQKRPPDVDAFVADMAETFGVQKPATNPNPQPSTPTVAATPPAPPNGTPPPNVPPPVTKVTSDLPDNVRMWTEDQWIAYYAKHGADPGNPLSWKNSNVHRDIGKRLEAAMAQIRIKR